MTIAEIIAARKVLIRESAALARLGIKNREPGRQWLRRRLAYQIAMLPRQAYLYALGDVDRLKLELDQLAKLTPPRSPRP
jgi:hypothetical protein